jgi:putative tricarboxylic transport membrane protein
LFWFGILGFLMRQFGFPLAPMILGVVLGNIAELNLARALAITTELTPFVTRPWSLLFLILAIFSAFFPLYQRHRNARQWTVVYAPAMAASVSLPMFMMGGVARPLIAIALLILSGYLVWHRTWKRPRSDTSGTS